MEWALSLIDGAALEAAEYFGAIDWKRIAKNIGHIVVAFFLALPIGWERGKNYNVAGLRTFPIVAMASCGYALIATDFHNFSADAVSRVIQGLVAGIGFIGGGAIIKDSGNVQGVATAASIWNTGAIGMAVGYNSIEIAITLAAINFMTLICLTPISEKFKGTADKMD
jgi:putative Mg2+ transporter-C (MgtC) family protein